jgi:cobyrinic acid a,c-diamide synthase
VKAIVIGGTVSGVGKTTISTGLMAALRQRGIKVQPFKVGPDYIDPGYHTQATGEPSRNLDTWMVKPGRVCELFQHAMQGKEMAVIEGVMGLYDSHAAITDEGSTAEVAKLFGAPVILVLDAAKGARSLAAMVMGYQNFDRGLNIGGVILNGIGSPLHFELCRESIEHYTGVPVMGYLPKREDFVLPERHLGLVTTAERPAPGDFIEKLIVQIESTFQMEAIIKLAEHCSIPQSERKLFPEKPLAPVVKIGLARDQAFSFYYQDNLDLLVAWGAEIVPFSPISDRSLPDGISGLYIGGGFPELYSAELAGNLSIKQQIKGCVERGMPVYAECGGLMYLGQTICDFESRRYAMVGAIAGSSRIDNHRLTLGYRTVQALTNGPLMLRGETARGHEFHWSVLDQEDIPQNAYRIVDKEDRKEGFQKNMTLASYIHLHFATLPSMAPLFVGNCKKYAGLSRQS